MALLGSMDKLLASRHRKKCYRVVIATTTIRPTAIKFELSYIRA